MKALQIHKFGNPERELMLYDIDEPMFLQANEVKIKVTSSCINYTDIAFIKGSYENNTHFPITIGTEGVGIIVATGSDVSNFKKGDRVTFLNRRNAWAEYIVVPYEKAVLISDKFDDSTAAQLMLNPIAALTLIRNASLQEGDFILITAGNSSISRLLCLFSLKEKLRPILVVNKLENTLDLQSLGAVAIIEIEHENLYHKVNEITNGYGVSAAFDAIAGKVASEIIPCLSYGGTLYLYGNLSNERVPLSAYSLITRNLSVKSFQLHRWLELERTADSKKVYQFLEEVRDFTNQLQIKLPVAAVYPCSEIQEALKHFLQRGRNGKIILTFK